MYFQTLDDKSECVGVYANGALNFDNIPEGLTRTWKFTGSVVDPNVEYGWLYADGDSLLGCCPKEHQEGLVCETIAFMI